jgi:toluene monooxygenase system ferredoxin subunit
MVSLEYLRNAEIFDGLTDEELARIQLCCDEITLSKDTPIFMENDPADFFYTLTEGTVSVRYKLPFKNSTAEQAIASITSGSAFGWSSLQPSRSYTLSAYCVDDNCKAVRIDQKDLYEIFESNHSIGYKVMKNLARLIGKRFAALQDEFAKLDGQDAIDGW